MAGPFGARDARVSIYVHLLGLGLAGVGAGLSIAFGLMEDPASPVMSVGWAAGTVGIVWSLVLAWRGAARGGHLGLAVGLSHLVLTEVVWALVLVWISLLDKWYDMDKGSLLKAFYSSGFVVYLFMVWLALEHQRTSGRTLGDSEHQGTVNIRGQRLPWC